MRSGSNVYVGVNAIAPGRRSRTREAIRVIRHVFLEADHDGRFAAGRYRAVARGPALNRVVIAGGNKRSSAGWRAQSIRGLGREPVCV
jgi:alkanesulfonate monooxygenase SsuD/methylene tetrahydromethanopterin reductase-like flavin-dependent oxidoreductase (luciferase family)